MAIPDAEGVTPLVQRDKDGFKLVEDAYFRYSDVMYAWTKYLKPNHANAVKPLIYARALTTPEHPLWDAEEGGLKLYIGYDSMGAPRLLFHLKQLEYLQYYIHELHLTSPTWVEYYNRRGELMEEGKEKEALELKPPAVHYEGGDDCVPLPNSVYQGDSFKTIEPIVCHSSFFLVKISKEIQKEGRKAESNKRLGYPPPTFSSNRFDAIRDNMTPGPGLRKGPEKQGRPVKVQNQDDGDEVKGWGGFPLATSRSTGTEEKEATATSGSAGELTGTEGVFGVLSLADTFCHTGVDTATENEKPSERIPTEKLSYPSPLQPPMPLPSELNEDYGMRYHFHCQQAFLLAVSGGLAETFPILTKPPSGDQGTEKAEEDDNTLPEVGRSLFISLCVTRWEKDPKVILEVGWSTIWWQKKVDEEIEEGEPIFEEMRDFGHLIISDHLLSKRNGESRPDYRDDYLFGDSLPLEQDKLRAGIQRKLKDLTKKSGSGPIYIVTHTPAGQEIELKDIGLDVSSWHVDLQPDGWDVPPYMSVAGCGSVFVINTASLFGSIEQAPADTGTTGMIQAVGRTKKSLQHTALLLFGKDSARKPQKCGNAGNDAYYTLEIFLASPPLPELRAEYQHSQLSQSRPANQQPPSEPVVAESGAVDTSLNVEDKALESLALPDSIPNGLQTQNGTADTSVEGQIGQEQDQEFPSHDAMREDLLFDGATAADQDVKESHDNESESDDDDPMNNDIQGVFYEDEEGNLVELSD
ncbi:hypothetical protein I316_07897 [Kwoniella heveanensis BCC8398]|uniref:Gfd2/YDR514C-like C-terminal domain-containing protein n=1 Tax=Kwoniella heveanensis BCC8398 TaxID=1296120 RepID=A0A1B9GHQ6_9TREE|nr:hypothetical protein I316_07897 [Kwoniella heveanensis BCC8398]